MKERPILFSGPMIRAILANTKTQTRRVVKPQPTHPHFGGRLPFMLVPDDEGEDLYLHSSCLGAAIRCPYGRPGDRLWVQEAWAAPHKYDGHRPADIPALTRWHYAATENLGGLIGRLSIHMPRWASRITLEVTGVRVERLQDISEDDTVAEGIPAGEVSPPDAGRFAYRLLWEQINGPGSWDANPWVWVVEFKRVEAAA